MGRVCEKVELFVDGELGFEEAEAFRQHLPECVRCQGSVANLMQLKLLGQRYLEQRAESQEESQEEQARPLRGMRWRAPVVVAASALAAAVLVVVALPPSKPGQDVWLAERKERPLEARLSYRGAGGYRPMASTMMGEGTAVEGPPLEAMAKLQKEDEHGLAAAYLVHGDPGQAERLLKKLRQKGRMPELDSDLAVARHLQGRSNEALQLLDEVLAKHPGHGQALWNRGLVLRELELPLMAAQSFSEAADLEEPGWSEEAVQKAKLLRGGTEEKRTRWQAAYEAGRKLRDEAPGTLPEGFEQSPRSRHLFYDAVRSAPTRERVLALVPLAQKLDEQAGDKVLEGYVRRVAEADFTRRAPLAREYAELAWGRLAAGEQERLVAALLKSKEEDILLGVLLSPNLAQRDHVLLEKKAGASEDPWLRMLTAQVRAEAEAAAGRMEHAIELLLKARSPCPKKGFEYLCILVELDLSTLYFKLLRAEDARKHAGQARAMARRHNDWELEQRALRNLEQIARLRNDTSLARAYLGEYLEHQRE